MAAQIQPSDGTLDKFSKLLPADVTAAFISTKSALVAANSGTSANLPVVLTFAALLCLCPWYFTWVSKVADPLQRLFLWLSSLVFAVSLANKELTGMFIDLAAKVPSLNIPAQEVEPTISGIAIVLPIVWTLIISQIAATQFKP